MVIKSYVCTPCLCRLDGTLATDVSGKKGREILHKDIYSKLHLLSGALGELSSSLNRHTDMCMPRYI